MDKTDTGKPMCCGPGQLTECTVTTGLKASLPVAKSDDTIMVMCRSGGRSAMAANMLAKAGFTNVYNIIDGMEGDAHGNPGSVAGDGWKNSGCPWTKKITPDQMILSKTA